MTKVTKVLLAVARTGLYRQMPAIAGKSKVFLVALSITVLGLTTTASHAAPSMQQQLETLQRNLEQMTHIMQLQQILLQLMQRLLY